MRSFSIFADDASTNNGLIINYLETLVMRIYLNFV